MSESLRWSSFCRGSDNDPALLGAVTGMLQLQDMVQENLKQVPLRVLTADKHLAFWSKRDMWFFFFVNTQGTE